MKSFISAKRPPRTGGEEHFGDREEVERRSIILARQLARPTGPEDSSTHGHEDVRPVGWSSRSVRGSWPSRLRKSFTNVPYTSSVSSIKSGRFVLPSIDDPCQRFPAQRRRGGIAGVTTKNSLFLGPSSFSTASDQSSRAWAPQLALMVEPCLRNHCRQHWISLRCHQAGECRVLGYFSPADRLRS
jgi:hypothetical protein